MKKLYLIISAILLFIQFGFGQGENNNWIFGSNNAGVNFINGSSTITPTVLSLPYSGFNTQYSAGISMYHDEGGCATVSKADGSLLFYTDGHFVYNKLHLLMSTTPLMETGAMSKQVSIIFQNPANLNQYYIINTGSPVIVASYDNWSCFKTVVDFTSNPNGQVGPTSHLGSTFCEGNQAITVTKNLNGDGFWVLVPIGNAICNSTAKLIVYKVDNISGLSSSPTVINNLSASLSYYSEIKVSTNKLSAKVCISSNESQQKLMVYPFDRQTGQISSAPILSSNYRVISSEFSLDGNLLYAIIDPNACYGCTITPKLVVFDLLNPLTPYRELATIEVFGTLQRATNNEIYFTNNRQVTTNLYKIDNQNSFSGSTISTTSFDLGTGRNALFGLPQLVPTFGWPVEENPCSNLTLITEPNTGVFTYQNRTSITTQTNYNVDLATQDITLKAKDFILLKPNTLIKTGSKFLARIQSCSATMQRTANNSNKSESLSKHELTSLYPNPNKGTFKISLNREDLKEVSVEVYDIFGKSVYQTTSNETTIDIDIPNLQSGMYIVKLTSNEYQETMKFIKD